MGMGKECSAGAGEGPSERETAVNVNVNGVSRHPSALVGWLV